MRLLAVRNDRLGDFMLAWPAIQGLRLNLPDARIAVLARSYTAPLATLCKGVDEVLCDPAEAGEVGNARALARIVRAGRFDAAVSFFSRFDSALGLALARVPLRVAPATKLAQVFHTHRLRQRRSRSVKPEFVYNIELAEFALRLLGVANPVRAAPPYLRFPAAEVSAGRRRLCAELGIAAEQPLAFFHPGHGGSAEPPPVSLLAHIARGVVDEGAAVVLSEGPTDAARVAALGAALAGTPCTVYRSRDGLVEYARRLAGASLFVSGSTGPAHIAGALDLPTVCFYPRRRSASSLRWQTLSSEGRRLAFSPPASAGEEDYAALDPQRVVSAVRLMFRAALDRDRAATGPHI